jgi:hypothetical protein
MTRDEAMLRCQELNEADSGERRWFPKQVDGDEWEVVALSGPGLRSHGPLKQGQEARPSPSDAPDPRPSFFRNIPPYGG